MDDAALKQWLKTVPLLFPDKPPGYTTARRMLKAIAEYKLRQWPNHDRFYQRLPEWAKWRTRFPVSACVQPGKKFKKHVNRDNNPMDLLRRKDWTK
jgi:hypothetical protein